MRKINLADYTVKVKVTDKSNPIEKIDAEYPYRVKDSILNLMFIPQLQLSGAELVKQNMLAIKLENCTEGEIIIEDEEYQRIKKAFDTFKGFRRMDVELVERINNAEKVDVKPA